MFSPFFNITTTDLIGNTELDIDIREDVTQNRDNIIANTVISIGGRSYFAHAYPCSRSKEYTELDLFYYSSKMNVQRISGYGFSYEWLRRSYV